MNRCRALLSAVVVTPAVLLAGCGSPAAPVVVDERSGEVDEIGLGDSATRIRKVVGRRVPLDPGARLYPSGYGFAEVSLGLPRGLPATGGIAGMRLDDRSFLVVPRVGAIATYVWARSARTRRGVGVGDDLALARQRYPGMRCYTANEAEAESGGWPFCVAKVGNFRLGFGEDPIQSITMEAVDARAMRGRRSRP